MTPVHSVPFWEQRPTLIFALFAGLLGFAVAAFAPQIFHDGDTWWHLAAGGWMLDHQAVLRREHVRESEVDKVVIDECFRPGDLVQALVASLGDARSLFLSTVRAEHGVVWARAEATGNVMRAVSAGELEDAATGARERRKVAVLPPA